MAWSKALIREWGEQIWRDDRYNKNGHISNSYCNATAAVMAGLVAKKSEEKFRLRILHYARVTPIPEGFI